MTNDPGHYGQPDWRNTPPPHDPYNTGWRPAEQPQYGPPAAPVPPPVSGPGYPSQQYEAQPYMPAPEPVRPKKRQPSKLILGIVAAVTVVCCGGLAIIIGTSKDNTNSATNPPTTGAPATGAAGFVQWWNNGGRTRQAAFVTDSTAISAAASKSGDYAAVSAACKQFQSDVEAAQAYPPIPDAQAQVPWAAALAQYARGATDCIAGADSTNDALIIKGAEEITAGNTELAKVTARIGQLGG